MPKVLDNKELVLRAAKTFEKMGIVQKDDGVIDTSTNFGGYLPVSAARELINLTVSKSGWLQACNNITRAANSGTVLVRKLSENVSEFVGENEGTPISKKPTTWQKPYTCKKAKSDLIITTEELKAAMDGGIDAFEQKMREDFAVAVGNDIADVVVNGDTSLDSLTSRNRLRRGVNGFRKQLASANVHDAEGKAWGQGIWSAIQKKMPEEHRTDPNLNWLYNDMVDIEWHKSLTNVNTTEHMRSSLSDRVISTEIKVPPLGKPQLVLPQLASNYGPAAIAPTSVVDDADGTATVTLTTMVTAGQFATAAAADGRQVKVTYKPTGKSETLAATNNSGTLELYTVGTLGQETISTTASEYTVQIVDETELYYMNPKGIYVIMSEEIRSFSEFNKDYDRIEVTTYYHIDVLVPVLEDKVKFERVTIPNTITW